MTVAMLAARRDEHTVRWANALAQRGHNITILSMHQGGDPLRENVSVRPLRVAAPVGYFLNAFQVRRVLDGLQPDLVHSFFASGYGTLATLATLKRTQPYLLSVLGQDISYFPAQSPVHRWVLRQNLLAADHIGSTSQSMARKTLRICPEHSQTLTITPFGIDATRFSPVSVDADPDTLTIGTVKKLENVYGIDVLIDAFARLYEKWDGKQRLRLRIVGTGSKREALERQAQRRGISRVTTFVGRVPHAEVPRELARLDVYAALSRRESFGVAVLEASACERPVVVTRVGGLPEVVRDGSTGLIVPSEDPVAAAQALGMLARSPQIRREMGAAGRAFVTSKYLWSQSVDRMEKLYQVVAG